MRGSGVLFFDLTQLVLRVVFPTPSGIGRVELAYAKYLLDNYPDRVKFLFALPRLYRITPNHVVARYLREIQIIWQDQDVASSKLENKINAYLNKESPSEGSTDSLHKSNRLRRNILVAKLLINVGLNILAAPRLSQYSNSKFQNVYLSVSNSIITSRWLVDWLARSPSVSGVFLLHDIIPITNPEFTLPKNTIRHERYVRRLAKTARTIVANSSYTYDCLVDYAAATNLSLPEVVVAPLGVEEGFITELVPRQPTAPYFVFTATIEPRKNHIMILQVWQRLVAKLGRSAPKLLLVGRRGWENENTLDLIERAENLRDHVIECGNVPDKLLIKLLANARAALFPSHIEGYGLPLAEALSLGVPVICSDIQPFREIAGDTPEYADPLAGRGWLKLIMEYAADDSPRRAAQISRIGRFRPNTWDDHFSILDWCC